MPQNFRNALQAMSNSAADAIGAPVDGIAWLLRIWSAVYMLCRHSIAGSASGSVSLMSAPLGGGKIGRASAKQAPQATVADGAS